MRDILFRGKRVDNGNWAYGYFVSQGKESYIFEQEEVDKGIDLGGYLDCCQMREVIPETVGQLTGLTDKDGIDIFDGDIVAEYKWWIFGNRTDKTHYEIKHIDTGYFYRKITDDCFTPIDDLEFGLDCSVQKIEVVGNIHDNPELLEWKV